uniref:Uncharacterized protein n=1 Tax=Oryza sativa subsp. japonica TaxID=39947 RepID=Q6H812_ORYSJ|nr:hypothetical protein [Oryza sativa Japonica Group]
MEGSWRVAISGAYVRWCVRLAGCVNQSLTSVTCSFVRSLGWIQLDRSDLTDRPTDRPTEMHASSVARSMGRDPP